MQLVLWNRRGTLVAELVWPHQSLPGEVEHTLNATLTRYGLTDPLHAGMGVLLGRRRFHYLEDPQ